MSLDEFDCIENFKMARRCTIQLPYSHPKLLLSYADYFLVGAYANNPFQVDIFDRSKTNIQCIDVAKELKRTMRRYAVTDG